MYKNSVSLELNDKDRILHIIEKNFKEKYLFTISHR